MIKLIIFDLDGVLVESKEFHFRALNVALRNVNPKFVITKEEHLSTYDALPTKRKLTLLTEKQGLPERFYNQIWKDKQDATLDVINEKVHPSQKLIRMFQRLKNKGYSIAVASNSVRNSTKLMILKLGLMSYVDIFVSNEDVKRSKPFPEMYYKCMIELNALPKETIIIEDSHVGRQAAIDSGSILLPVENCADLTDEKLWECIDERNLEVVCDGVPWRDKKLNVLIPMAGAGSRFEKAGYTFPKPLIDVEDQKPMIQCVFENLNIEAHYIFIVQKYHFYKYQLRHFLNLLSPGCDIIQVDTLTEGAACTTLLAKELIDNENPLLIANSDQLWEWNSNESMYAFTNEEIDAAILTFHSIHPKWSYAKLDENGFVCEVAEKKPISDNATVGIYYWKHGSDYVKYAERMIKKNIRVNNEFYVCPVFNEAIEDKAKVKIKKVDSMWGLGTPEDLKYYQERNRNENN